MLVYNNGSQTVTRLKRFESNFERICDSTQSHWQLWW